MKTKLHILNASTWLLIELTIITIVAWIVLDPAIVNLYYRLMPLGYDTSRLLYAETKTSGDTMTDKDGSRISPSKITEERQSLMQQQLTNIEGVESVYIYNSSYGSIGYTNPQSIQLCNENDTMYITTIFFTPGSRFFETYGLKPLSGSPSAEQLSNINRLDRSVVLTRSAAIAIFGSPEAVGRRFTYISNPPLVMTVAGVVEDFRTSVPNTFRSVIMMTDNLRSTECRYIIRLKPGVNAKRFVEEHGRDIIRNGQTDFNRISRLMTYEEHLRKMELDDGRTQEVKRSLVLTLFFLVNLMLAVIGTIWLHVKRHTEECGVRRAFGATRRQMLSKFLIQQVTIATIAVLIGCFLYLNYAYSGRSVVGNVEWFTTLYTNNIHDIPTDQTWVDHFWMHFLAVSSAVYFVILFAVSVGTAIPAVKIIDTKITHALRDE